ncbi:helix-turn-helix domain-containing protein [Bosea sp. (in: a-proteobacteria)]|uniref:helix-turn-helix domain-containing protein n=1 Tax=Bosea sp. (in: a-proteobacteria) TaxID=1871050 RepID=UPI00262D605E|nr:helix-turn-helix domain-containing protein [Bosea sp. (in: a-proteobacteria)]MCO5092418.1 chromosomal replication initiator DnaA [Bosea sp. (in: a-proteobacteria)]
MNKIEDQTQIALRAAAGARLAEAASVAAARVPLAGLRAANRGRRPIALARQTAMYLAHVVFGLSLTRVGICFGRDRTTVRHACALIEDRRDDPRLEFGLTALEAALLATMARLAQQPAEAGR